MGSQLMHYSVYDSSANIHTLLVAEPKGRALGFYLTGFNRVFLPPVFFFFFLRPSQRDGPHTFFSWQFAFVKMKPRSICDSSPAKQVA